MAGSKFQYDESGGTFFYFLLSFLALVVVPCTYYFWPKEDKKEEDDIPKNGKKRCHCDRCGNKRNLLRAKTPWKKTKNRMIKFALILGWLALAWTAYKVTTLQHDYVNWDPFEILGIDPSASTREIKRAYHKLSLVYHPDKETGDEKKFMMITKAYAALTDDDSRKNWELYGNPDGPGATSFGIALPSWIVEKENSLLVLGVYALVFMIALPTIVGIWWYNSVKYGGDEVLLDTSQLYYYLIHKSPHMVLKRVIMIIAASTEFEKQHNSEIVERPSDNVEVPQLIRELPNLNEKNRERPLCFGYSVKARALLYAHLSRLSLPPNSLEVDKNYIVKKCPALIQEFVSCVAQLTMLAVAGRISRTPSLDTLEAAMKLSPLVVQALWDSKNPLLQLPHFNDDIIRHMTNKKRNIRSLVQLASMKDEERRSMLRILREDQYEDVLTVLGSMPLLDVDIKTEVLDDEDSGNITAGAIVTVTVTLTRKEFSSLFGDRQIFNNLNSSNGKVASITEEDDHLMNGEVKPVDKGNQVITNRIPVWDKKGKFAKKYKKQKEQQKKLLKEQQLKQKLEEEEQQVKEEQEKSDKENIESQEETNEESVTQPSESEEEEETKKSIPKAVVTKNTSHKKRNNKKRQESDSEDETEDDDESGGSDHDSNSNEIDEDDEEDWEKFQKRQTKKSKTLDSKTSRLSHPVHCPFFPDDKQEFWWIYLADKKKNVLTSFPVLITNLVDSESIDLKLTAPGKPGVYQYSVVVRSDSYVDFDVIKTFKLDVKEAKIVEKHPQWDMSDVEEEEEEAEESAVEDSDLLDESEDEDNASS